MNKYLLFLSLSCYLFILACTEKTQMKLAPMHMSKYENCTMSGPTVVYNMKLYGSQKYMGVNNYRLTKNHVEIKNLLPSLAPKFQGMSIGADVLTNGGDKTDLIMDFESIYHDRFPIVLKDGEKLELTFYSQERPADLNVYCEFYWDNK